MHDSQHGYIALVEFQAAYAQEQGAQPKAEASDKLAAMLKLECELEAVREQAAQHEDELRTELQQARRDKQEAEAKLGGLDLNKMKVQPTPHLLALLSFFA